MTFAIVYENFSDVAQFAGGSWDMPLENLRDPDIGLIARSSGLAASATQFTVDLGSTRPIGGIVIGPANIAAGATYRFRGYTTSDMSGTAAYDSTLREVQGNRVNWSDTSTWLPWEDPNFWTGITPTDAAELPFYLQHLIPAASAGGATARYWKIEINDPNNADGYVALGRLLMGRIYRPSVNYAPEGNDFGIVPLTDTTKSLAGSETSWEKGLQREFRAAWPALPQSEFFDHWVRMMLRARTSRHVFVVPEEMDTEELMRKRAFLATFKATPRLAQVLVRRASTSIDLQEVL